MPRLSIVIPCLGGAADFDGTLVSVLQNRPADCEILVLHTEPYDDPYGLGNEVRFIESSGSLVDLLNLAVHQTSGEVLHVVGCGLKATEGWTATALAHFDDAEVASVSPLIVSCDQQRIVAGGVRWSLGGARKVLTDARLFRPGAARLRASILGPTLLAAFYRREVLAALDGFDPAIGDPLADVGLALAIQSLGRLHVCDPDSRLIQTANLSAKTRAGFPSGRAAERLFWRYASQRGTALPLMLHPLTIAAELIRQAPGRYAVAQLLGRAASCLEIGAVRRHLQHLDKASQRLAEVAKLREIVRLPARRNNDAVAAPQRRRAA